MKFVLFAIIGLFSPSMVRKARDFTRYSRKSLSNQQPWPVKTFMLSIANQGFDTLPDGGNDEVRVRKLLLEMCRPSRHGFICRRAGPWSRFIASGTSDFSGFYEVWFTDSFDFSFHPILLARGLNHQSPENKEFSMKRFFYFSCGLGLFFSPCWLEVLQDQNLANEEFMTSDYELRLQKAIKRLLWKLASIQNRILWKKFNIIFKQVVSISFDICSFFQNSFRYQRSLYPITMLFLVLNSTENSMNDQDITVDILAD